MTQNNKTDFDWLGMYTTARYILGWSEEEFWKATPKKYFAVIHQVGEIRKRLTAKENTQEPLVGNDAMRALSQIASRVR